jgi:hypothetical protein
MTEYEALHEHVYAFGVAAFGEGWNERVVPSKSRDSSTTLRDTAGQDGSLRRSLLKTGMSYQDVVRILSEGKLVPTKDIGITV